MLLYSSTFENLRFSLNIRAIISVIKVSLSAERIRMIGDSARRAGLFEPLARALTRQTQKNE